MAMQNQVKSRLVLVLVLVFIGWGLLTAPWAAAVGDDIMRADDTPPATDLPAVQEQWVKRFNGAANLDDEPGAMVVSPTGNVYVAGSSGLSSSAPQTVTKPELSFGLSENASIVTGGIRELVVVKYAATGKRQWVVHDSEGGTGCEVAGGVLDQQEHLFVLAECECSYVTAKYDQAGHKLWMKRFQGDKKNSSFPSTIAVDDAGNAYVTGTSWQKASNTLGITTVKYSPNGAKLWVSNYDTPGNNTEEPAGLVVDKSGNVYIPGEIRPNGVGGDMVTIKLGPDGKLKWAKRYNGPANGRDSAGGIALDPNGNVHVTGSSEGLGTDYDYVTIKYTPGGKRLWVARFNGAGNGSDHPSGIALDPMGNVFVAGQAVAGGPENDFCTVKYSPDGKQRWVRYYNGPANSADWASALAVDAQGRVYVTGTSVDAGGKTDCATVKYSAKGKRLWEKRYNGPANDQDHAWWIRLDTAGNAYVCGSSTGVTTGRDMLTIKYGR
jgi:hypothetical protein